MCHVHVIYDVIVIEVLLLRVYCSYLYFGHYHKTLHRTCRNKFICNVVSITPCCLSYHFNEISHQDVNKTDHYSIQATLQKGEYLIDYITWPPSNIDFVSWWLTSGIPQSACMHFQTISCQQFMFKRKKMVNEYALKVAYWSMFQWKRKLLFKHSRNCLQRWREPLL